jgi:hypothetical protein
MLHVSKIKIGTRGARRRHLVINDEEALASIDALKTGYLVKDLPSASTYKTP